MKIIAYTTADGIARTANQIEAAFEACRTLELAFERCNTHNGCPAVIAELHKTHAGILEEARAWASSAISHDEQLGITRAAREANGLNTQLSIVMADQAVEQMLKD